VPYFLSDEEKAFLPDHILSVVQQQGKAISHALCQIEAAMCKSPSGSGFAESENSKSLFLTSNRNKLDITTSTAQDSAVHDKKLFSIIKDEEEKDEIACSRIESDLKISDGASPVVVDRNRFEWAWFTVNTRAVYLAVDPRDPGGQQSSAEDSLALAPYLDLLNHSANVTVQAGVNIQTSADRKERNNLFLLVFLITMSVQVRGLTYFLFVLRYTLTIFF
jgi:hypothetical protein